jgi:hypothetical protein
MLLQNSLACTRVGATCYSVAYLALICWAEPQVGALLLSFLPVSLQEQISARKYFYKSALVQALAFLFPKAASSRGSLSNQVSRSDPHTTFAGGRLIKDGIITLSGTDFSRDIMDQVRSCSSSLAMCASRLLSAVNCRSAHLIHATRQQSCQLAIADSVHSSMSQDAHCAPRAWTSTGGCWTFWSAWTQSFRTWWTARTCTTQATCHCR